MILAAVFTAFTTQGKITGKIRPEIGRTTKLNFPHYFLPTLPNDSKRGYAT
jgi:hypothetical protein